MKNKQCKLTITLTKKQLSYHRRMAQRTLSVEKSSITAQLYVKLHLERYAKDEQP